MNYLSDVVILDLTRYYPGPFATLRLQERGASVIKIEFPSGNPARKMFTTCDENTVLFRTVNRGKKCVSLNFRDAADLSQFEDLIPYHMTLARDSNPYFLEVKKIIKDKLFLIGANLVSELTAA